MTPKQTFVIVGGKHLSFDPPPLDAHAATCTFKVNYSGDLKSDNLKSRHIWKPWFLKVRFQKWCQVFKWSGFSNGYRPLEIQAFLSRLKCFLTLTKWRPVVWISSDWAFGLQIPFKNPDHSKSRLVRISDHHFTFYFLSFNQASSVF